MRRLKKKRQIITEAIACGITSPGGLARAVYLAAPADREARLRAAKLRYYALGAVQGRRGRPRVTATGVE